MHFSHSYWTPVGVERESTGSVPSGLGCPTLAEPALQVQVSHFSVSLGPSGEGADDGSLVVSFVWPAVLVFLSISIKACSST